MLTRWQQLKLEREASEFPDIELMGFVSRGSLVVLQTSGDAFETMNKQEKLNSLTYMIKSLEHLKSIIEKERF